MKKFLKIMACAVFGIAMVCTMSSCKKYNYEVAYSAKLSSVSGGYYIITNATNYLTENGAFLGDKIYTVEGTSEADLYKKADALAKADFEMSISKLKVEEGQAVLQPGESFTYSWTRNENGNQIVIGEWKCSKPAE